MSDKILATPFYFVFSVAIAVLKCHFSAHVEICTPCNKNTELSCAAFKSCDVCKEKKKNKNSQ